MGKPNMKSCAIYRMIESVRKRRIQVTRPSTWIHVFIRQHSSTTYGLLLPTVQRGLSVCLSHYSEPCKNGSTDRDAVWIAGSDGLKESYVRWESTYAEGRCHGNQFWDALFAIIGFFAVDGL